MDLKDIHDVYTHGVIGAKQAAQVAAQRKRAATQARRRRRSARHAAADGSAATVPARTPR